MNTQSIKKVIFVLAILFVIGEGFIIYKIWPTEKNLQNNITLGSYYFNDSIVSSGFLKAQGSWISDTKLGAPLQTSDIICMRNSMLCTEAIAQISDMMGSPFLSVSNELYDIDIWNDKEIVTKPNDFACARYIMRFDLVQKIVTQTRTTLSTEGICERMDKEPIHLYLGDGLKVKQKANK